MEIIGEACRQISDETRARFPEVPWRQASGMHNYLIHECFDVNYDEVWQTLEKKDLPILKIQIEKISKTL